MHGVEKMNHLILQIVLTKRKVIVVIEYIRYKPKNTEQAHALVQAYRAAGQYLNGSPHCNRYELSCCVEDPLSYILRIEWDSMEGHLDKFRKSPEFAGFLSLVRPFIEVMEEMRHYQYVELGGQTSG